MVKIIIIGWNIPIITFFSFYQFVYLDLLLYGFDFWRSPLEQTAPAGCSEGGIF